MAPIKTFVTIKKNGKHIATFPSRSWTINLWKLFYPYLYFDVGSVSATDITNTSRTLTASDHEGYNLRLLSGGGGGVFNPHLYGSSDYPDTMVLNENVGIVIGTSASAVTPTDYAMGTKILHGTASGKMEYGGMECLTPVISNPDGSMKLRRYFTNNSGGTITVNEVGIYSMGFYSYYSGSYYYYQYAFCIARDLTGGVAVDDTEILEVTYTVQITV